MTEQREIQKYRKANGTTWKEHKRRSVKKCASQMPYWEIVWVLFCFIALPISTVHLKPYKRELKKKISIHT